jgi:hypothetical protein
MEAAATAQVCCAWVCVRASRRVLSAVGLGSPWSFRAAWAARPHASTYLGYPLLSRQSREEGSPMARSNVVKTSLG